MQRVLHAGLLFFHLGLGCGTDVDDRHTAGQFGQPLLQFLAVVVGGGLLDLATDLVDSALDLGRLAVALDDRGSLFVHHHGLGPTEVVQLDVLQLDSDVLGDEPTAGQDGDVFAHRLPPITEPRRLDRAALECASQFVYDQGRQGFAFYVFGDHQQRFAGFGHLLQQRQQVFEAADLFLVDEDVAVLQPAFHRLRIGHEVGRQVALVELHSLNHLKGGFDRLGLFDGDRTVFADLVHGVGNDLTDHRVPVRGHGGYLLDLLLVFDLLGDLVELIDRRFNGLLDTPLDGDRVGTRGDVFESLAEDRLGQDRRGRGPVTGDVAGLTGDLSDHLGPHVLKRIFQFDLLGHRHAVLGDRRRTELLVDDHIASFRTQSGRNRFGQFVHTPQNRLTGIFIEE